MPPLLPLCLRPLPLCLPFLPLCLCPTAPLSVPPAPLLLSLSLFWSRLSPWCLQRTTRRWPSTPTVSGAAGRQRRHESKGDVGGERGRGERCFRREGRRDCIVAGSGHEKCAPCVPAQSCAAASLCPCLAVSLCHCTRLTVPLSHCVAVSLLPCLTVFLCHCASS